MKTIIKTIKIFLLVITTIGYSQVNVSVQGLQYTNNGQATVNVTNCGIIDLASSTSSTINLGITLTKPYNQVVGLGELSVYTQKSPSDTRIERVFEQIQESFWTQPSSGNSVFTTTANFSINTADFNVSGGTLFVVFKSSGNIEYLSCGFTIKKTPLPAFALSPATLALSCDDTNVKNFTVTPSNIPAGATVTYQWSFSGWSGTATSSMSSVNLTPISGTTLPSSVTVTPFINGVAKPSMSCIVSRGSFNPNYTITGNNQGCPGSTTAYSISVGTNTVSWSVSNPALATLNTTTGNNVLLTGISNGSVNLNALVTNSCGQSKLVTKTIAIGTPVVTNNTITGGSSSEPINSTTQLSVAYVTGATGYNWTVNSQSSSCVDANGIPVGGVTLPKFSNGSNTITTVSPIAFVNWGSCPGDVVVNCSAVNACGNKGIGYKVVSVYGYGGGGGGEDPCQGKMTVSPNPVKDDVFVVNIALPPVDPCGPVLLDRTGINNKVTIYDLQGNKVFSKEYDSNKISISNLNLRKGHYVIHADSNKGKNHKSIIVVE